ncbi:MAG: hypothetical protein KF729_08490 [Sandaracinaceae bacterium]|nr:hypothetical protein [Sandaracinaceae bacterium]
MSQRTVVLYEGDDPDLAAVAAAVRAAIGVSDDEPEDESTAGAIALPVSDAAALEAASLADADVAVVLDEASQARARAAGVRRLVALLAPLDAPGWELDADVVLVAHEVLVPELVARGVARERVRVAGPVAPAGWAPHPEREALRARLGLGADRPWVVVRAAALDLEDLAPSLVQLSLVSPRAAWIFDVGADAEAARLLRRRVPGYGLDAHMVADGPDALDAYQAADLVLGRIGGVEALRAFATGAGLVTPSPARAHLGLAHRVETAGLAQIADAAATLSVTLDAALAPAALAAARATSLGLDAAGGAARVALALRALEERIADAPPAGLPRGIERLSDPEAAIEGAPERAPGDAKARHDDLEKKVDDELAALRRKLGL